MLSSLALAFGSKNNKQKRMISPVSTNTILTKKYFDSRPNSNIKEKVTQLRKNFESKLKINEIKDDRSDREFLLKFKNQKNEILSLLKPTEKEKHMNNLSNMNPESKIRIERYSRLCDKMKGFLEYDNKVSNKKSLKISSPLQTYF